MMRNGANTADLRLLTAWTDDRIYVGGGGEAGITLASSTVCPGSVTASTEVNAGTAVAIGATPAQSGALRLGNNEYVKIRNGTNTDDLLGLAASANTIYVGDHIAGSLVLRSAGTVEAPNLILTGTPFLQMTERPAIGNAPANGAYVFLQDNGSGKTQLMIQFATGAAIQLAIQP
jgi:hypothetical protein